MYQFFKNIILSLSTSTAYLSMSCNTIEYRSVSVCSSNGRVWPEKLWGSESHGWRDMFRSNDPYVHHGSVEEISRVEYTDISLCSVTVWEAAYSKRW